MDSFLTVCQCLIRSHLESICANKCLELESFELLNPVEVEFWIKYQKLLKEGHFIPFWNLLDYCVRFLNVIYNTDEYAYIPNNELASLNIVN